jgi:ABC-type polysaccharide/polyol phosphate transport system ATPase subunit
MQRTTDNGQPTIALRVEGVSKQYRIYDKPSHRLTETLTRGRVRRHREFWALRDVSFALERGTTTGVIGPNGSGKSTLLQIVTGTLEPTHGSVHYDGRVSALLELGAGFNLEFTGLENVFMNGALQGLSRAEVERLLPEIERFAEIGDFIHQPVKTYSSGMFVRLAFAVAISTQPDLLIVDEALSVGDAVFQHRCLRRIKQMQEQGATILFVSHDPGAVRALCNRALLLNAGRVVADGKPADALNVYQKLIMEREEAYDQAEPRVVTDDLNDLPPLRYGFRHGDQSAEILSAEILKDGLPCPEIIESGAALTVRLRARFKRDLRDPLFGFLIRNKHGINAYGANTDQKGVHFDLVRAGEIVEVTFNFDAWLGTASYSVAFAVHSADGVSYDWLDDAAFFRVVHDTPVEGVANLNASAHGRRLAQAV